MQSCYRDDLNLMLHSKKLGKFSKMLTAHLRNCSPHLDNTGFKGFGSLCKYAIQLFRNCKFGISQLFKSNVKTSCVVLIANQS